MSEKKLKYCERKCKNYLKSIINNKKVTKDSTKETLKKKN